MNSVISHTRKLYTKCTRCSFLDLYTVQDGQRTVQFNQWLTNSGWTLSWNPLEVVSYQRNLNTVFLIKARVLSKSRNASKFKLSCVEGEETENELRTNRVTLLWCHWFYLPLFIWPLVYNFCNLKIRSKWSHDSLNVELNNHLLNSSASPPSHTNILAEIRRLFE